MLKQGLPGAISELIFSSILRMENVAVVDRGR